MYTRGSSKENVLVMLVLGLKGEERVLERGYFAEERMDVVERGTSSCSEDKGCTSRNILQTCVGRMRRKLWAVDGM
jgi:hypothetical protein